jgi:hypothetical protein
MGWLFIDTHELGTLRIGWLQGSRLRIRARQGRGQALLPLIEKLLRQQETPEGIYVVEGPGTFSSIRTGVLVANLLARLWQRPLVPLSADEAGDVSALVARHEQKKQQAVSYVAPLYNAEPNITKKK